MSPYYTDVDQPSRPGNKTRAFFRKYPGPFYHIKGRCGVDDTFDIHCETSNSCVIGAHYWDAEEEAERVAGTVALALNRLRTQ